MNNQTIKELEKEKDLIYREMIEIEEQLISLPKSKERNELYKNWKILHLKTTELARRINFNNNIRNLTFKR